MIPSLAKKRLWLLLGAVGVVLGATAHFCRAKNAQLDWVTISDWYQVRELRPDLFEVNEPDHVSFFILRSENEGLFIDSGLGLSETAAKALLKHLNIKKFSVIATHAHFDHVGLNYLADRVLINEQEWDKYVRLNERDQISKYYDLTKETLKWPVGLRLPLAQRQWKPAGFVTEGQEFRFGRFLLTALLLPGHCLGHLILQDKVLGIIFSGDLLYDGTLYLHLPDSSFAVYRSSMAKLAQIIASYPTPPLLLPCHNTIPLDASYVKKAVRFLDRVGEGKIRSSGIWKADGIFVEALNV